MGNNEGSTAANDHEEVTGLRRETDPNDYPVDLFRDYTPGDE